MPGVLNIVPCVISKGKTKMNNTSFNDRLLPAGQYWIGDLCYVMHEVWDEFCDKTLGGDTQENVEGVIELDDGRRCGYLGTAYGDGEYPLYDAGGRFQARLGVDAGLIGVILADSIDRTNLENNPNLGCIIDMDKPIRMRRKGEGTLMFGDFVVETAEESDEDDGFDDENDEY